MKLANIESNGRSRVALVLNDEFIDLTAQLGEELDDVPKLLRLGAEGRERAEQCIKSAVPRLAGNTVKLRSPILHAGKITGVGWNYHSQIEVGRRLGISPPAERLWFSRPNGCIAGPHDDVWLPRNARDLDFEAELAVVIGRTCRNVTAAEAPAFIGGFTIANDLTLRERAAKSPVLGKCFDTHTPLGPCLVTPDELGDPHRLALKTWINGELRQDSSTADMIANCYQLIAELSAVCILKPGDIILTGTPDGCGIFRRPISMLAAGDVMKMEIEGIGVIENRVVDEPAAAISL